MTQNKYTVTVNVTSHFDMVVEAENPEVAVAKAKTFPLGSSEIEQIISNMTRDTDTDNVVQI